MAWPVLAAAVRVPISAGGGWIAVSTFNASPAILFVIVAAWSVVSALIFVAADLAGAIWQKDRPREA